MKTIKWGIIGLGNIAHKFAADIQPVEGCILQAVASRSLDKAKAFGIQYNANKYYDSYQKLTQDPEVDVVYIATPHVQHAKWTLACIANQKAVLCEKPFAMNAAEVNLMINAAQQHQVFLMEALWTRFLPHYRFVIDELESGKYGAITSITADFCFKAPFDIHGRLFNKNLGGGALLDVGIYPVFCALSLLGEPQHFAANTKIGKTGVDEDTAITFYYSDGVKAHLKCSIVTETPSTATILCENGILYLHTRFHETDKVTTILNGVKTEHDFNYQTNGYSYEIAHVAECLRNGKLESPLMPLPFSNILIKTLDAIRDKIGLLYDV